MHEVLVNRLGGLSLLRKSVVRLTDRPDMTLDVYRGRKTTIQYNFLGQTVRKLEKMPKIPKGHKTKNSKSFAYLQIMMKHSAKFQVNSIKDVGRSCGYKV